MKKLLLQILSVFMLVFSVQGVKAQIANGDVCPDFTGTDLNGNTWHLYDLLNQGKTVVIDVSAAWCDPCWAFHNTHALDNLWDHHGPSGTLSQDMVVLFIEGEGSNSLAQLQGTTTNQSYSGFTQGDWITGSPYPIIDNDDIAGDLRITSFPTVYVVCPDRSVTEVYWEDATESALYALAGNCALSTTSLDAGVMDLSVLNPMLLGCDDIDISARISNYGSTNLTSATIEYVVNGTVQDTYNWTGNLATYENAVITNQGTVTAAPGDHTVTVRVTNPNNGSDGVSSNNSKDRGFYIYETTGGTSATNDFETDLTPAGWHFLNSAADGRCFVTGSVGCNSSSSMVAQFYYAAPGATYELYAPEINLTSFPNPVLEFDVAHANYSSSTTDRLKVMAMTCSSGNWVELYNKTGSNTPNANNSLSTVPAYTSGEWVPSSDSEWRHDLISLSQFSNEQSLIIKFVAVSDYGNTLLLDNINVKNSAVGVDETAKAIGLNVYPNPFSNLTNVYYNVEGMEDVNVRIYNVTGQEVYANDFGLQTAGTHNFQVDASAFATGMYVMNLNIGSKTVSHKLSVTK